MPQYQLKGDAVEAEGATDHARVRVFTEDGGEVLMKRSDFEALFEVKEDEES